MHVFNLILRKNSRARECVCVCRPLSRANTETIFYGFYFYLRATRKKNGKLTKEDGIFVRLVLSFRVLEWMKRRVVWQCHCHFAFIFILSFSPPYTILVYPSTAYLYRALCTVPFSILIGSNDNNSILDAHDELIPNTKPYALIYVYIYTPNHISLHSQYIVQCETYDSRQYKICNRLQIKSNSSEHTQKKEEKNYTHDTAYLSCTCDVFTHVRTCSGNEIS